MRNWRRKWYEQDVLEYIVTYNVRYASVYRDIVMDENGKFHTTGVSRTGCMFCMFGCHLEKKPNRFQRLAITHPKIYEYCIHGGTEVDGMWQPDNKGLGLGKVLDFIGVDYRTEENISMASKMFENLNAIVANTLTDSIKMIDIDELHESADNFFIVDRIEEFADTILGQGGVKDNLIVRPMEEGGYEIISGHRRRAAVQLLLDRGENISRYLPCLVQDYSDEAAKLIDIVLMNVTARQISDAEMWQSYELLSRILQEKKSGGERFGRVREKLAELLNVSPAQIGKMQNVENNAIPSVAEAVAKGELSISTANEIARLDAKEQEKLVQQGDLSSVKHKEVKQKNAAAKAEPDAEPEKVDTCSTNPEPDAELEKVDTCSTNPEPDAELEKVDTCSTNPEPDAEPEKVDTCSTNPEPDTDIEHFIFENYYELESIFESYMSMTENEDETELLKEFIPLMYRVKETIRNQVRLGI